MAVACNGGGKDNGGAPPTSATRLAADALLTPGPKETPRRAVLIPPVRTSAGNTPGTSTPVTGATAAPTAGSAGALIDLLNAGANATFRVTYRSTFPGGDECDQVTIFNRPPLTRVDVGPPGSTTPQSVTIGRNGGATVNCSGVPKWECLQINELGSSLLAAAGPIILPGPSDFASGVVTEIAERTVAGQPTRCFDLTPPGESSKKLEYCLNAEGVPLYSTSTTGTVEATSISTSVTDADFRLPR